MPVACRTPVDSARRSVSCAPGADERNSADRAAVVIVGVDAAPFGIVVGGDILLEIAATRARCKLMDAPMHHQIFLPLVRSVRPPAVVVTPVVDN